MDIITCPEVGCSAAAEIIDRWEFPSTAGRVEHIKTRCLLGHILTPAVDSLPSTTAVAATSATATR
jgi:hypothetical protein